MERATNILGRYRLIAELGQGGMAEVFLAVVHGPAGFNKLTVLKRIRPQLAEDPEFLAMFLDEARLAARLNHPNVVQTNEVGHEGGCYFIAMEYLEGQPLNRVFNRLGRDKLPLPVHLRILADTLAGLHYAHDLTDYDGSPLAVVHRDVTPHNIFITYDGQVKIVDFGIAKAMNSSAETRTGVLKGKVAYMSPEQARGDRVDRRADVFSVGVLMWEAAVGRRLWKGLPDIAILSRIVNGEIPQPRSVRPDIPPDLEAIILRATAIHREDRHRSASELQADIERLLDDGAAGRLTAPYAPNPVDRRGERVYLRDTGQLLAQAFEEERSKIRTLIEAQLRDARAMPTDEYRAMQLPVLTNPSTNPSSSISDPAAREAGVATDPHLAASSSYRSYPGSLTAASTAHAPSPPRSRALLFPIAAVGGATLAFAIWLIVRGAGRSDPIDAPLPDPAAPIEAAAEAPAMVEIKVTAKPAEAHLLLDGAPLSGNPASARLPRDGKEHTLRIEAEGYVPETRALTLDNDLQIELALERAPASGDGAPDRPAATSARNPPTAARAAHPAARSTSAPEPTDDMKPVPKPVRPLDTTNPFATP